MSILTPILRPILSPVLRSVFDAGGSRGDPLLRDVLALYKNGEQGALYYFTEDFAGLYQDAAGTTPVTAVGQPVGLMLDRRFGLVRGVELISSPPTNGSQYPFDTLQISGTDIVSATKNPAGFAGAVWDMGYALPTGAVIEFVLTVNAISGVLPIVRPAASASGSSVGSTLHQCVQGLNRLAFTLTTPCRYIQIGGTSSAYNFSATSVSAREVPGNHASQATTTARPTLRSGPLRIDYDGVDDYLRTVFPALGSNVTIARSIPGVGAQYLTGQTIAAGNWDDNVDSCATLVIDRALTGPEQALVTAFLNQQAGV